MLTLVAALLMAAAPPSAADKVNLLARQDLAERLKIDAEKIETASQKETVWPDGSLGCPKPGMNYIQMLVPGYIIELRAQGKTYTYHSDKRRVVHCD